MKFFFICLFAVLTIQNTKIPGGFTLYPTTLIDVQSVYIPEHFEKGTDMFIPPGTFVHSPDVKISAEWKHKAIFEYCSKFNSTNASSCTFFQWMFSNNLAKAENLKSKINQTFRLVFKRNQIVDAFEEV